MSGFAATPMVQMSRRGVLGPRQPSASTERQPGPNAEGAGLSHDGLGARVVVRDSSCGKRLTGRQRGNTPAEPMPSANAAPPAPQSSKPHAASAMAPGAAESSAPEPPRSGLSRVERAGRNAGILIYSVVVVAFTVTCAIQILHQVWWPESPKADVGCRSGVLQLADAVERARLAAADGGGGERAALERFRATLGASWRLRPALDGECRSDAAARAALREVDRLRYAEEHAVRYEATDLANRRVYVRSLTAQLAGAQPDPSLP